MRSAPAHGGGLQLDESQCPFQTNPFCESMKILKLFLFSHGKGEVFMILLIVFWWSLGVFLWDLVFFWGGGGVVFVLF